MMDYQDVLAELGAGSAHPGGHRSTLYWAREIPLSRQTFVLDVGCGTGRTLIYLKEQYGCQIHGVDIRKKMIEKARKRAYLRGIDGVWKVAGAERLPYPDCQFDLVCSESVNVFADATRALQECHRVLKPGGWYVDVEMMVLGPVSSAWRESVLRVYGARHVPDQRGWKKLYDKAGFTDISVLMTQPVRPAEMASADQDHPDDTDLASSGAYQNPRILDVLRQNSEWLEQNHHSLGYGIFRMRKGIGEG